MSYVSGVCCVLLVWSGLNVSQKALSASTDFIHTKSDLKRILPDAKTSPEIAKLLLKVSLPQAKLARQSVVPVSSDEQVSSNKLGLGIRHEAKYLLLPDAANDGSNFTLNAEAAPQLSTGDSASNSTPEVDPSQPRIQDYRSVDPPVPSIFPEFAALDFRTSSGSDNKLKRILEPSVQFLLKNGDEIRLTTGWNFFDQDGIESVNNYPVRLGWKTKLGQTTLQTTAGLDFFDDLAAVPTLGAKIDLPLGSPSFDRQGRLSQMSIFSTSIDHGAYKFSARSLQSRITATQIKPSIYWQITPSTSFYAHYQFGIYNDGNNEHQVFGRLQQKLGSEFYIAANLFSWRYSKDAELASGYFSPPDFLTYTGEIGWEGEVIRNRLKCQLSAAFGRQRNQGNFSGANAYNARCSSRLSADLSLELGYSLSNIRDRSSSDDFQTQEFFGQLKYRFD